MRTPTIQIAVYGKTIITDPILVNKLEEKFRVFYCEDIIHVWNTLEKISINLLLLEIGTTGQELKILKELQIKWPLLHIISLGLEKPKEHLIKAFKYGSNDFFKIPLNIELLIERIEGIVRRNNSKETSLIN